MIRKKQRNTAMKLKKYWKSFKLFMDKKYNDLSAFNSVELNDVIYGAIIGATGAMCINMITVLSFIDAMKWIPFIFSFISLLLMIGLGVKRYHVYNLIEEKIKDKEIDEDDALIEKNEKDKIKFKSNIYFYSSIILLILSSISISIFNDLYDSKTADYIDDMNKSIENISLENAIISKSIMTSMASIDQKLLSIEYKVNDQKLLLNIEDELRGLNEKIHINIKEK